MSIKYNAPATLSFSLAAGVVLILDAILPGLAENWFLVPGRGGFDPANLRDYVLLLSHVLGHAGLDHYLANFFFILLLGPVLEERYGSGVLAAMTLVTALATGLLNVLLFPTALMGASGIVFMMILLSSFTNFGKGEIPLTFILILVLYLGKEVINAFTNNDISEFSHIIGGLCGSLFGFLKGTTRPAVR